jgi:hypothetical protein
MDFRDGSVSFYGVGFVSNGDSRARGQTSNDEISSYWQIGDQQRDFLSNSFWKNLEIFYSGSKYLS